MGQNNSVGMSGPWLRRGEGGEMKETLFIQLVTTSLVGATESMEFKRFTIKAKINKYINK
jgi:hypothetical protein